MKEAQIFLQGDIRLRILMMPREFVQIVVSLMPRDLAEECVYADATSSLSRNSLS